jgi:hypothetical protein
MGDVIRAKVIWVASFYLVNIALLVLGVWAWDLGAGLALAGTFSLTSAGLGLLGKRWMTTVIRPGTTVAATRINQVEAALVQTRVQLAQAQFVATCLRDILVRQRAGVPDEAPPWP